MNHILVSLSSSSPAEPVATWKDLERLVYRYAGAHKVSVQEAYNTVVNSHNRFADDPVYGPGYNGPRRLADELEYLIQREEQDARIGAFLLGGLAALAWLAMLMWLWSSL